MEITKKKWNCWNCSLLSWLINRLNNNTSCLTTQFWRNHYPLSTNIVFIYVRRKLKNTSFFLVHILVLPTSGCIWVYVFLESHSGSHVLATEDHTGKLSTFAWNLTPAHITIMSQISRNCKIWVIFTVFYSETWEDKSDIQLKFWQWIVDDKYLVIKCSTDSGQIRARSWQSVNLEQYIMTKILPNLQI